MGFAAKQNLAGDGVYYEPRWFAPWPEGEVRSVTIEGADYPVGDLVFECNDVRIGFEICEDGWAASRPGAGHARLGVDLVLNPSASHFAFGKQEVRKRLVLEASRAFGATYLYTNLLGNESGRLIFDGGVLVASAGGLGLPPAMADRCSPNGRMARLQKSGGKAEAEQAVVRGLRFLMGVQNPDGSFGGQNKVAMTGLALLAFLGHCETPDSPEFGNTVRRAIDWLVAVGAKNKGKMALGGGHWAYEHGIGTYALGEAYALTGELEIEPVFIQAMDRIVYGQGNDGGWMYQMDKETPSDTSVSGWQVQALKSAYLSGLAINGVEEALTKSNDNMRRVYKESGKGGTFGYRQPGQHHGSLTGAGALCMQIWKEGGSKEVKGALKHLVDSVDHFEYKGPKANLYSWYYDTQACFMKGGSTWTRWNRVFQDELLGNQAPDGSWPPAGGGAAGKNGLNYRTGAGGSSAAVYRTSLCVLMLEVYYRYLPTLN